MSAKAQSAHSASNVVARRRSGDRVTDAGRLFVLRPPLSGRLLVTGFIIWPIFEFWKSPDIWAWNLATALFIAFLSISLWRIHVYCDDTTVAFRPGRGSRNIRRDAVAAVALSPATIGGFAFLDSSGSILLSVPGAWRSRDVRRMTEWLGVPVASAR